jgi:hypothetical protein
LAASRNGAKAPIAGSGVAARRNPTIVLHDPSMTVETPEPSIETTCEPRVGDIRGGTFWAPHPCSEMMSPIRIVERVLPLSVVHLRPGSTDFFPLGSSHGLMAAWL